MLVLYECVYTRRVRRKPLYSGGYDICIYVTTIYVRIHIYTLYTRVYVVRIYWTEFDNIWNKTEYLQRLRRSTGMNQWASDGDLWGSHHRDGVSRRIRARARIRFCIHGAGARLYITRVYPRTHVRV